MKVSIKECKDGSEYYIYNYLGWVQSFQHKAEYKIGKTLDSLWFPQDKKARKA